MSSKKMKSELLILRILMCGNRVFADISKMSLSGWGPTPIGPVFWYHEDRHLPRGKTACCPRGEDSFVKGSGGRDWNHIATKPRNSKDCSKETARKRPSSTFQREQIPANTSVLDPWRLEPAFVLLKAAQHV